MDTNAAISVFQKNHPAYCVFTSRLHDLIEELLKQGAIKTHFMESRAKTLESFSDKVNRPGKSYKNPVDEMPDLCGIRVIVYYTDDLLKVGALLKEEFNIIEEELSHQPSGYSADKFGYLSAHYVIGLAKNRAMLPEWRGFAKMHAEIQVRTVLQHAWAAVSHALQYKREGDVPFELRRRLFRLAGLFEIADEEFIAVRNEDAKRTNEAKQAIAAGNEEIRLDAPALIGFIETWDRMPKIEEKMKNLGFEFFEADSDNKHWGIIVECCEEIGIRTLADFKDCLNFDPNPYLEKIKTSSSWRVTNAFALLLLLIRAKHEYFSIEKLKSKGWGKDVAARVIAGAKATSAKEVDP